MMLTAEAVYEAEQEGLAMRELEPEDLPECAALGLSFYEEGDLPGKFIPEVFTENWKDFFHMGIGRILGAWEDGRLVGVVGGVLSPDVNDGELVANEMFWYVLPGSRGVGLKLLANYLHLMREAGAKRLTLVHLCGLMPDKLERFYERLGLKPLEIHYRGSL